MNVFSKLTSLDYFKVIRKPNETAAPIEGEIPASELFQPLIYTANISQVDTDPPTANGVYSTIGEEITFGYIDQGKFNIEKTTPFDLSKTRVYIGGSAAQTTNIKAGLANDGTITIWSFTDTTASNDLLVNTSLRIEIYP